MFSCRSCSNIRYEDSGGDLAFPYLESSSLNAVMTIVTAQWKKRNTDPRSLKSYGICFRQEQNTTGTGNNH